MLYLILVLIYSLVVKTTDPYEEEDSDVILRVTSRAFYECRHFESVRLFNIH